MTTKPPMLLVGAAGLLATVMLWWGAAFLPLPTASPEWVARARAVCFSLGDNGLPQRAGWLMLIGAPLLMAATLGALWGNERAAVRDWWRRHRVARRVAIGVLAVLMLEAHLIGTKICAIVRSTAAAPDTPAAELSTYPRQQRSAPDFALIDEAGRTVRLSDAQGRVAYVGFVFAHCRAVCPRLVETVTAAQRALGPARSVAYLISLDPWRDTVGALAAMHRQWALPEGVHVLSGSPDAVNAVLDAYQVPRTRDTTNGDVVHPALIDVIAPDGTLAYVFNGPTTALLIDAGETVWSDVTR